MTGAFGSTRVLRGALLFPLVALLISLAFLAAAPGSAWGFADDFADAPAYKGGKASYQGVFDSLASATRETGEPGHAGSPGIASAWISWTPSKDQVAQIIVCSGMDSVIGVYTGTAVNALTEVASNDENSLASGCGAPDATVRFQAKAGTKYMIAVDTKDTQKNFRVDFRTLPPNDDFANATEVPAELPFEAQVDNRIATMESGEPAAGGYTGGHTVWYRWTAPKSGMAVVSTCTAESTASGVGVYTGTAVNGLTEVAGNAKAGGLCHSSSEAVFQAVEGTTYRIQVDGNARYGILFLDIYWNGTRSVAVTRSGSGEGTVASAPAGIECGLVCEADFYRGIAADYWRTRVTLTATPAPGSVFTGWSGEGCSGTEPVCELVVEEASAEVDAEFEALPPLSSPELPGTDSEPPASIAQTPSALPAQAQASPKAKHPKAKCAKRKKGKKGAKAKASKRRACKR